MITISERLLGMWQFEFPGGNWLGAVEKLDDCYKFTYRFRYYVDDKIGMESEDVKNWYEGTFEAEDDEAAVVAVREILQKLRDAGAKAIGYDPKVQEFLVEDGDVTKFIEHLGQVDSMHVEVLDKSEAN